MRRFLLALALCLASVGADAQGLSGGLTNTLSGTYSGAYTLGGTPTITGLAGLNGWAPNFGVTPDSVAIGVGGTGYAAGDTVTLTCSGCTITTNPIVVIGSVSSTVATNIQLRVPGVITNAGASLPTFTQLSTSGTGTGLTVTGNLGPLASGLAAAGLNTGGGAINGNLFIGAEQPNNALYGTENTFIGDRAGSMAVGNAIANTFVGHNAGGNGNGGTWTGSFNTMLGNDAGRNITSTAQNNTGIGQSSLRIVSGTGNTAVGQGTLPLATGNNNTVVGAFAGALLAGSGTNAIFGVQTGNKITAGANRNLLLGPNVATTILATGSDNVLIGTTASIDTAGAATSNTIQIGAGSTCVFCVTGTGTVTTAVSTLHGLPVLPDVATGTPTASLCLDVSNNIVKKTTTGACI